MILLNRLTKFCLSKSRRKQLMLSKTAKEFRDSKLDIEDEMKNSDIRDAGYS